MSAPLTSTPPSADTSAQPSAPGASSGMETKFSAQIDYDVVFGGLEQKGIALSEDEKKRFKEITAKTLDKHDNAVFSGLGPSNIFYLLFAFLGNLLGGQGSTDLSDLGSHLSSSNDKAVEMSKLRQLHGASMEIKRHLEAEGGNLAAAAGLATAVHENGQAYQPMEGSIYKQLMTGINLPEGSSSTLASLSPRMQTHLPRQARTEGLTQRG